LAHLIPALTLDGLAESPWALDRAVLAQLVAFAQRGEGITAATRAPQPSTRSGAVAVIPIHGVIEHRASFMLELFGGTSIEDIRGQLRSAVADQQVGSIVLDVDSPGGGVGGVTELAAEIRAARAVKRVVAVANTTAASAGYWLASQADHVLVTPSGQLGAVGVFAVHFDVSRMLDAEGVTPTIISAGERKTDGIEFAPLSDDARADMQKRVDTFYAQFVGDVAKGRRVPPATVLSDYGQGAVFLATDAVKAGLADGIGTLEQALSLAHRPPAAQRAEGETPDPSEIDLPFRARAELLAEEAMELAEHATVRARLREKEGRPRFSPTTEAALRSTHGALTSLLAPDQPAPTPEPAADPPEPVTAPPAPAPVPSRFRSDADWSEFIRKEFTV
jgi:signal peptide peptidase SppA